MDAKTITLLITLATVCANLVFALTGVTNTVSCTVGEAASHIKEVARAAFNE